MCGWLAAAILAALPGLAESREPTPRFGFGDRAEVRMINLEVVVTAGGERVGGLRPRDFRVLVDGQEVGVEFFTEVREGHAVVSSVTDPRAQAAVVSGEPVATNYLLFVDDLFAVAIYRNRILRALSAQLSRLGPADHVAVLACDGREVERLTGWTRSQVQLRAALTSAAERPAHGLRQLSAERRSAAAGPHPGGALHGSGFANIGFFGALRGPASAVRDEISRASESQLARVVEAASVSLAGRDWPAGRRVVLLVAGGWPAMAEEPVGVGAAAASSGQRFRDLEPLVRAANGLGFTIYPVSLRAGASAAGAAEAATTGEARWRSRRADRRGRESAEGLTWLARATGGRALLGRASLDALARAVDDGRSYYWLGLSPDFAADDLPHRLAVELRRPGLQSRSRLSFSDLSRQSAETLLVRSAQLNAWPLPKPSSSIPTPGPSARGGKGE